MRCAEIPLKSFGKILTVGQGQSFCELSKLISTGNTKLPNTTAIFNMSSAKNCPSYKLGLCKAYHNGKHICYAKKSENEMRKNVEPYRNRQMRYWLSCTAEEFIWQFLLMNALKEVPWTALRFNEAGDFWSQDCVDKAERIATVLDRYKIKTYCYTSRDDLDYREVRHLIISGSGFMKEGITNEFKIVEDVKKDRPKGYGVCPMDCTKCNRCQVRGFKTVVPRH